MTSIDIESNNYTYLQYNEKLFSTTQYQDFYLQLLQYGIGQTRFPTVNYDKSPMNLTYSPFDLIPNISYECQCKPENLKCCIKCNFIKNTNLLTEKAMSKIATHHQKEQKINNLYEKISNNVSSHHKSSNQIESSSSFTTPNQIFTKTKCSNVPGSNFRIAKQPIIDINSKTFYCIKTHLLDKNKVGRLLNPGRPLSMPDRERILELYQNGHKISHIAKLIGVTHSCVSKIMTRYRKTGSMYPRSFQNNVNSTAYLQLNLLSKNVPNASIKNFLTPNNKTYKNQWQQANAEPDKQFIIAKFLNINSNNLEWNKENSSIKEIPEYLKQSLPKPIPLKSFEAIQNEKYL